MNSTSTRTMHILFAMFCLPFLVLVACSHLMSPIVYNPPKQTAYVTKVVDGDTIKVDIDGTPYTVRYIGIDTPETVHPQKPVEFMGKEASAKNKELVNDKEVLLEKDISETDKYGRLLRYVWVSVGNEMVMVNAELVRLGYAQVSTYPPDVKYTSLFLELQRQAKEQKVGLWK